MPVSARVTQAGSGQTASVRLPTNRYVEDTSEREVLLAVFEERGSSWQRRNNS